MNYNGPSTEDRNINALYELQHSTLASDLVQHHRYVIEYYESFNNNRELNHNFVRGFQYEDNEIARYRDKRKTPVVFNSIKTSERTILGLWINNKYAVKFNATTPIEDDIASILEQLNMWESDQQNDEYKDVEMIRQSWAGGNSFQECYMDIKDGAKPKMFTHNQNPFAVYWDPESRILITREDAQFVDRDSWWTLPELQRQWPKEKKNLEEILGENGDTGYENTDVFADRTHEHRQERNGSHLVTERFYKVPGRLYFMEDPDGARVEFSSKKEADHFSMEHPGIIIQNEYAEELWLAIVCEDYSNTEYLYNGPYHCQPRDPRTKKIIWPIVEMVAESLAGEPQSFVDHERDANKIVNQMMSNILASANHSAAAAMLIDSTAFVSETEAKLAARHHSDSDRSFKVRPGRTGDAMAPVPRAQTNADHQYALDYSLNFLSEVSSTPPALQGIQEAANTPGVLNAQRIEQGATQLRPFMKNWQAFLKQRAKLRYYYWRTYYTSQMTFRIVDKSKPEMDPYITINQVVPEMDALGEWAGTLKKLNDINVAEYDISIEEDISSPSYRQKQLDFIERMMNSGFVQVDSGLAAGLLEEALRLSDASPDQRNFLKKYSTLLQQAEMQKRQLENQTMQEDVQSQQLDNTAREQQIAQTEAEQTALPPELAEEELVPEGEIYEGSA